MNVPIAFLASLRLFFSLSALPPRSWFLPLGILITYIHTHQLEVALLAGRQDVSSTRVDDYSQTLQGSYVGYWTQHLQEVGAGCCYGTYTRRRR